MSTELTPFDEVTAPDAASGTDVPADPALGRLTAVAGWFAARRSTGGAFARPRLMLVGDPDDAASTVTLADRHGIGVTVVSTDGPAPDGPAAEAGSDPEPGPVTGDPRTGDVLDGDAAVAAVDAGRRAADREIDAGADLLVPGLAGGDHEVALGVLICVLTGLEPVAAVTVPDTDPVAWAAAVTAVRDTVFRLRERDKDVLSLVAAVAGPEIGALAGLLAQAAVRRTPVLLDGLPATVAAVLAHRLAPGADAWFLAAGPAADRAGRRLQGMLGLAAVTDLGTSAASGGGAVLILPLVQAALTLTGPSPDEAPA